MPFVYKLTDARVKQPSMLTIGVFDGIHKGHQSLIKRLVHQAHTNGKLAVALTFFPHPDVVLRNLTGRYYLTSPEERAEYMQDMGIDCVVIHPFDDSIRQIRATDFVDQLVDNLHIESLWVGADFAMGYRREGNVDFLRQQGAEKGFNVEVVELIAHELNGTTISSSTIRAALAEGQVERIKDLLGRSYSVRGEIVHGEKRGRQIGFPTANIDVWKLKALPANGVYAGWATLGDERFMAVTNVGVRPTFAGDDVTIEAHLLDFNRDIYNQQMELTFETRLRPEKKFNGIDELIAQIKLDAETGRQYLQTQ